jgi:nitrate reductase gamma subunit
MWPRRAFGQNAMVTTFNGYVLHIGLALTFLAYAPHIDFVRRLVGVGWPALPDPVMYLSAAAVMFALLFALWSRIDDPVRRRISSADDYVTWVITFLPFVTGMAVISEPSGAVAARDAVLYRLPLAVHLLSLELLLLWFPFGKLMHAVLFPLSRAATGRRFSHRGVSA